MTVVAIIVAVVVIVFCTRLGSVPVAGDFPAGGLGFAAHIGQSPAYDLDPDAIGLGALGKREGYVTRQLNTWYRSWTASASVFRVAVAGPIGYWASGGSGITWTPFSRWRRRTGSS